MRATHQDRNYLGHPVLNNRNPIWCKTLEELQMLSQGLLRGRILAVGAIACAVLLAGCDEYVQITRDRDVHIARHASWAWRPAQEESRRGSRPVVSRDVITRGETVTREDNADNEAFRGKVKTAIA